MNVDYLFYYQAYVLKIYDGDTIRVEIDLGFGLTWKGSDGKGVVIRLYGIDTPEVRGKSRPEGLISRDRLRERILNKKITLKTFKDSTGKYGRYLGVILDENNENINDWLITEGLAVPYLKNK
jgi:micrococcal nuclease